MDQDRKTRLEEGGINLSGALERFMGNEPMLERYLEKFLTEKSYAQLLEAVAAGDNDAGDCKQLQRNLRGAARVGQRSGCVRPGARTRACC